MFDKISHADTFISVLPISSESSVGILSLFKKKGNELNPELIVPCSLGKNGITHNKKEGDLKTPAGVFDLGFAFGICDNPGTGLDYVKLSDTMYWVDDLHSEHYNRLIDTSKCRPDFKSGEHMTDYPGLYDYGITIGYNKDCIPGRGSAIFLHCTDDIRKPTSGCVAVKKPIMLKILKAIAENDAPVIAVFDSNSD